MANSVSTNPIKIDTAVANWAALNLPSSLPLDVRQIEIEPGANGQQLQLANADGTILFEATSEAATGSTGGTLVFYFQPRSLLLTKPQGWFPKTVTSGLVAWIYFVYA